MNPFAELREPFELLMAVDVEDLGWIIVALIYAASSFIKQFRKKGQEAPKPVASPRRDESPAAPAPPRPAPAPQVAPPPPPAPALATSSFEGASDERRVAYERLRGEASGLAARAMSLSGRAQKEGPLAVLLRPVGGHLLPALTSHRERLRALEGALSEDSTALEGDLRGLGGAGRQIERALDALEGLARERASASAGLMLGRLDRLAGELLESIERGLGLSAGLRGGLAPLVFLQPLGAKQRRALAAHGVLALPLGSGLPPSVPALASLLPQLAEYLRGRVPGLESNLREILQAPPSAEISWLLSNPRHILGQWHRSLFADALAAMLLGPVWLGLLLRGLAPGAEDGSPVEVRITAVAAILDMLGAWDEGTRVAHAEWRASWAEGALVSLPLAGGRQEAEVDAVQLAAFVDGHMRSFLAAPLAALEHRALRDTEGFAFTVGLADRVAAARGLGDARLRVGNEVRVRLAAGLKDALASEVGGAQLLARVLPDAVAPIARGAPRSSGAARGFVPDAALIRDAIVLRAILEE